MRQVAGESQLGPTDWLIKEGFLKEVNCSSRRGQRKPARRRP